MSVVLLPILKIIFRKNIGVCVVMLGILQVFIFTRPLLADSCEDLRIVLPDGRSGTFYLSKQIDQTVYRYPRAGYLPLGTLLKIKKPGDPNGTFDPVLCDGDEHFARCFEEQNRSIAPYLLFTASNGSSGWVRQSETRHLGRWFGAQSGGIQCPPEARFLIPIGATDDAAMHVYRIDVRNGAKYRSDNPVKSPTRTAPWLVTLADKGEDSVHLRQPNHKSGDELKKFLKVVWYEPLRGGGTRTRKDSVVALDDMNETFKIVSLPKSGHDYPIIAQEKSSFLDSMKRHFNYFFDRLDFENAKTIFQPRCAPNELKVKVGSPKIAEALLPVSFTGDAIVFKAYQAYEFLQFEGIFTDNDDTVNVFKIKGCREQIGSDLNTYEAGTISFSGIYSRPVPGIEISVPLTYWQNDLLSGLNTHFRKPLASGAQRSRAYMLLPRPEENGVTDPFTAYRMLYLKLEKQLDNDAVIPSDEKERLLNFILNTLVAPGD